MIAFLNANQGLLLPIYIALIVGFLTWFFSGRGALQQAAADQEARAIAASNDTNTALLKRIEFLEKQTDTDRKLCDNQLEGFRIKLTDAEKRISSLEERNKYLEEVFQGRSKEFADLPQIIRDMAGKIDKALANPVVSVNTAPGATVTAS